MTKISFLMPFLNIYLHDLFFFTVCMILNLCNLFTFLFELFGHNDIDFSYESKCCTLIEAFFFLGFVKKLACTSCFKIDLVVIIDFFDSLFLVESSVFYGMSFFEQ